MTEEPTGPDGSFLIEGLNTGETYELQLLGDTGPGPRKSGVAAPADGVEITVSGKGGIRGVVTDGEGHPVPDFEVAYSPASRGGGGGMRFSFRIGSGRGPGQKVPVHADDGGVRHRGRARGHLGRGGDRRRLPARPSRRDHRRGRRRRRRRRGQAASRGPASSAACSTRARAGRCSTPPCEPICPRAGRACAWAPTRATTRP